MFVPGLPVDHPYEGGHANYQHPIRQRVDTYNASIDRFSHLVIFTALHCLAHSGRSLWERYDNRDNLLFVETDFTTPHASRLFAELWKESGPARGLVGHLVLACCGELQDIPFV